MIVELPQALFGSASAEAQRALVRVLEALCQQEEHSGLDPALVRVLEGWDPMDPLDPVAAWLERRDPLFRPSLQALLMLGLLAPLQDAPPGELQGGAWGRAGPLRVRVRPAPPSDWAALDLTAEDTLALVQEPLHLRLENERHDWAFVGWLAGPTQRASLTALEQRARLRVHAGGCGELRQWLSGLDNSKSLDPEQARTLWRTWILYDRDAGDEDARQPSPDAEQLMALCRSVQAKHRIPLSWVCLQRREIESYLPGDALSGAPGRQLKEWRRRGDRQEWAWSYDMKGGLRGDLRKELDPARRQQIRRRDLVPRAEDLKAPFCGLDPGTIRALVDGYGGKVLNSPLDHGARWLERLADEYDLGPQHQIPRAALIQSLFDRV